VFVDEHEDSIGGGILMSTQEPSGLIPSGCNYPQVVTEPPVHSPLQTAMWRSRSGLIRERLCR